MREEWLLGEEEPSIEGKIVIVQPPEQWVRWGLVEPGVFWTLEKAVYGLRGSPFLWARERDTQLTDLRWKVGKRAFRRRQQTRRFGS